MFLVLTASADTYVTNKIIDNSFKVTDANVGKASTLDLFKLWDESTWISGSTRITSSVQELSRLLVRFDYGRLGDLTASSLDIRDPSFRCVLKLYDILGGQGTPTDFKMTLFPLSRSFDEGLGRDVISFRDIGQANFITASYANSANNIWFVSGANASGSLDGANWGSDAQVDIIERGVLDHGGSEQNLFVEQRFPLGSEDLKMDITKLVSASIVGTIVNHGFRLAFTSSQEYDHKTRFVKRFASRHVSNRKLVPRIEVSWDDSIHDNHRSFFFDLSGSLFLQNYHRGREANILSGASLTPLSGDSCMLLELVTGSFTTSSFVSQHSGSSTGAGYSGLYSASFCIPFVSGGLVHSGTGWDGDSIQNYAVKSGSLTFDTYWKSTDGMVAFHTGSLTIKAIPRTAFNTTEERLDLIVTNARSSYKKREKVKFRIFVNDINKQQTASRIPYQIKSAVLDEVYYRVRDYNSDEIIVPFMRDNNGTRLSTDSAGLYFEMFMEDLTDGRVYTFDFLVIDRGIEFVEHAKNVRFRVEK